MGHKDGMEGDKVVIGVPSPPTRENPESNLDPIGGRGGGKG